MRALFKVFIADIVRLAELKQTEYRGQHQNPYENKADNVVHQVSPQVRVLRSEFRVLAVVLSRSLIVGNDADFQK
jgi:hypothetical protein